MQTVAVRICIATAGLVLFFSVQGRASAQTDCSLRYSQPVFAKIDTARNITYGANTDVQGVMQTLTCDIYQPSGDTSRLRPMLVLIHGGSFIAGDKSEDVIVRLCIEFAQRGYVTASINYRLGVPSILTVTGADLAKANYRAVQDARAAVRFFHAHADSLRIDTNLIFAGGTSAGAFTAVQYAYLDQYEVGSAIDTAGLGPIEGTSGTPGVSSRIRGVINCWGAIGDTNWMQTGNLPIVSVHGTADNTVPYDAGWVFGMTGLYWVYGSASIHYRAIGRGVYSILGLFSGMGHQFPVTSPQMDTTVALVNTFLGAVINCDSGAASVLHVSGLSRAPETGAWMCMKTAGVMRLRTDVSPGDVRLYDCRGRSVDFHPVKHSGDGTYTLSVNVPGVYIAVDTKHKNHAALALHLY
jgi:poly(3-hydroxybutyrate) depolymerase